MSTRTITIPATGAALSSSDMRNQLQLLENEVAPVAYPVENEVVSGSGTSWTLSATPIAGSVKLWGGGIRLTPGVGNDYTISGTSITTANSFPAASLLADYRT